MKYKVVREDSIGKFEETVNKYLSEGWEPTGGFAMTKYGLCCQAIIHRYVQPLEHPTKVVIDHTKDPFDKTVK